MLNAYAVFANGGYRINAYLIARITDSSGKVLMEAAPLTAGSESNRALNERNAYLMDSLMKDVARYGTAARASAALKRSDIAGKTGTTNDSHDAWFAGYGGDVVAVGWMGFDQPRPLGERETGGGLALPIWIGYMSKALAGVPEAAREMPSGVVQLGNEVYFVEHQPGQGIAALGIEDPLPLEEQTRRESVRDQIF
jgi:penicillin-binding protein 1A